MTPPNTTANPEPAKRKRGPPPGSLNALKHGRNSARLRFGLQGSMLPKGFSDIKKVADRFRDHLETAVIAARGEVSITDAAVIHHAHTAMVAEMIERRTLTKNYAKMKASDVSSYCDGIIRSSAALVKAVKDLKLPGSQQDSIQDRIRAAFKNRTLESPIDDPPDDALPARDAPDPAGTSPPPADSPHDGRSTATAATATEADKADVVEEAAPKETAATGCTRPEVHQRVHADANGDCGALQSDSTSMVPHDPPAA